MFDLIEAVVEKGLIPFSAAPPARLGIQAALLADGTKVLREALKAAEKTAVMFEADLGTVPVANRDRLGHLFSAEVRATALRKAEETGKDPVEAVRMTADAVSCMSDISFLGQPSGKLVTGARGYWQPLTIFF
jgi:hypothetical protein